MPPTSFGYFRRSAKTRPVSTRSGLNTSEKSLPGSSPEPSESSAPQRVRVVPTEMRPVERSDGSVAGYVVQPVLPERELAPAVLRTLQRVALLGTTFSTDELLAFVVLLYVAGHETTANALSWTWVLLSRHPEVEARVIEPLMNAGTWHGHDGFGRMVAAWAEPFSVQSRIRSRAICQRPSPWP